MSTDTDLDLYIRSLFAPRPETTVTEWAEHNLFLPALVAPSAAGQYSTAHCAYLREFLEDFRDLSVKESANCFAAQVFKTTGVFVGIGYRIDQQPTSIMLVLPTDKLAKTFSKTKWQPIVESSPALLAHKLREKDKFQIELQQFDNSTVYFTGSGSENSLIGVSFEILVIDEIDKVEEKWAKQNKSGVAMLEDRVKSFASGKVIKTGTPTEITGAIWRAFLDGDRRLFFVECPECKGKAGSKPFVIEFDPEYTKQWFPNVLAGKVVWDGKAAKKADGTYNLETVRKTAALECPCCKAKLQQQKLPAMIAAGKWVPTNPDAPAGKVSRRLPSMYSPHEKCTLGNLAVKWLEAQNKIGGVRTFLNSELAVPHQLKGFTVTDSEIKEIALHSPPYVRGEIPRDNLALLCLTADYNQDAVHWITRAWFGDGSSALVDYGVVLSLDGLTEIAKRQYKVGAMTFSPMICLVDSGWRTKSENGVYDFCIKSGHRFVPLKGAVQSQGLSKTVDETNSEFKGIPFKLVRFDDNVIKHDLYFNKIKKRSSNWWLPRNIGQDYEAQLTDEYLKTDKGNAKWDTRDGNNHLGDAEKYQLLLPWYIETARGKDALQFMATQLAPRILPKVALAA